MSGERIGKLEALLERVRRNKTQAPVRSQSTLAVAPLALEPLASAAALTPTPSPVAVAPMLSSTPARVATPPLPSVAPVVSNATPPGPPVSAAPAPYTSAPAPAPPPVVQAEAPAPSPQTEPPPPVATPSWQPEPGSAVQPRPTTMPPMEISDDDLLDVTTLPPEAEAPATIKSDEPGADMDLDVDVDVDVDVDLDDQAPVSSSRFKVPGTLDEALASAAEVEGEREIPTQTPPPESGPQEALPAVGLEAARVPDVDQLEADLEGPVSMGPTAEQLGETIELEAPRGPELEIDVAATAIEESEPPPAPEELEVTLPRASLPSGLYDVSVSEAPEAPVVTLNAPPAPPVAVTVPAQASNADLPDRSTPRPAIGATDVARVTLAPPLSARSFVEMLDRSLGL